MDPNSEDLSIESCEKIHKQLSQKHDKCCVDAQVACAMSQEFLELLKHVIEQNPNSETQCKPRNFDTEVDTQTTSYHTYKYVQDFGRVIEAYPMSFEWFSKKTDGNEKPPNHNNDTTKDTLLENRSNENVPLGSSHSTTVKNVCNIKIPASAIPCLPLCPPPPCPLPPPCPPQSCDPNTLKIKCSSGGINFKLQCKKVPIDCQNTDIRYECELIDEGKCLDSKILESCDLKCEQIIAAHNSQLFVETLEDVNDPIKAEEVDNQKDDKKPQQKVTTMICSKDGVDFNMKCKMTTPDPDFPADIRFICEVDTEGGKQTVTPNEILSTSIRCRQVFNVIDDSATGDENANVNLRNENETNTNENSSQCLEDKRSEHKTKDTKENETYTSRSKPKIDREEHECDKSDLYDSANFVRPNKNTEPERSTVLENHGKTVNILRAATTDILCTISNATSELCENSATKILIKDCTKEDKLECVDAVKKSCEKLIETVCQGTQELKKLSIETLDNLANQSKKYICFEKECGSDEFSDPKLHKIRRQSSNHYMILINKSAKNINNDMTIKNIRNETSQQRDELQKNKTSSVKLTNEIKKWPQDEIEKTIVTVKKSCEGLYDKMCKTTQQLGANTSKAFNEVSSKSMKWFDSPGSNEPSTGTKNVKKVLSGLSIFHSEEETETTQLEDNLPSRAKWTDSIHFALTSLGDTLKEIKPDCSEKSSPYDKPSPPRQMKYDIETEESTPISNMFAALKEKICSMFYDQNESESTGTSSSYSDDSDLSDEQPND
ncbi:uncharacterized protein LOC113228970 [Hyposmocoma kahamanoa]|uniref:uncharacterized protein LOC113228970 n=1 Tax=Hyposmocoma kahamanoa TaxID=1477025 RepID=UPI000E6D73CA|nr:uncharacterized protein LOC113228970 [Hyposmocoma kahamanoa]